MTYDPRDPESRRLLASSLMAMLEQSGFVEIQIPGTKERVFTRQTDDPSLFVAVYTSIVRTDVRQRGFDAIRVCALYTKRDGSTRGVGSSTRVNRVGEISAICERTLGRMRDVWKGIKGIERCKDCGAPTFVSKKGNHVCAEVCWNRGDRREDRSRYSNGSHRGRWIC